MTAFEILLTILVAVNAVAFMYFMYVDQKASARSDALSARSDATWQKLCDHSEKLAILFERLK